MIDILVRFIPNRVKSQLQDKMVDILSEASSDERWRKLVRSFRSDARFQSAFEKALERAVQRFADEYPDKDLVEALTNSTRFWDLPSVQAALREVVTRPSSYLSDERDTIVQSFAEVVPNIEPERVEQAVRFFMRCLADEVITIPQLLPIYQVHLQKMSMEQARETVAAIRELQADQKQTMTALLGAVSQNQLLLTAPGQAEAGAAAGPKIYHNLPRPDYSFFVGREAERAKVLERLSPKKQGGVVVIDGVGGVGKSALALELAYYLLDNASSLPEPERFAAIVWTSAKQTVLTADGIRTRPQVLRNLEDIYTAISITLDREDILRARPEEQSALVMDALSEQRTLLIVDNLETVDDENLLEFLRELPLTTKAIVTTRHRIDVAYPVRLVGLSEAEALALIRSECEQKEVGLDEEDAKKLFNRTGGLPLAINWSIGLMGYGHTVDSVLARLGSAKSDVIKFSFQASVETIKDHDAYQLLLALSLFAKDATREALGFVAGFEQDEISRDDGLVMLEKLSLVNKAANRFSLLPLTKTYASAELEKNSESKADLLKRWSSYFLVNFNTDPLPYHELNNYVPEIPDMFGYMDWCIISNKDKELADFVLRNARFFWARGYWAEFQYYVNSAYERTIAVEGDRKTAARLTYQLAGNSFFREEPTAETLFLQSLKTLEEVGDYKLAMHAHRYLSEVHLDRNEIEQARQDIANAYKVAVLVDRSQLRISKLMRYEAPIEIAVGNYDKAANLLEESIEYQETDPEETSSLTIAYALLGKVEIYRGNFEIAETKFYRALELAHHTQVKSDLAFVLQNYALLKLHKVEKDEALEFATEAYNLHRQLGARKRITQIEELILRIQALPA